MTPLSGISRRRLLQTGLGAAAGSALGVPALTGCSNEGRGGSQVADDAVRLPEYIPYDGVPADLVGEEGVDSATLAFPADPLSVGDGPVGDGAAVSALAIIITPTPPALPNNSYWQQLNARLGFDLDLSLVPSSEFEQRFQTAVAGDQLPDLFTIYTGQVPSLPGVLSEKAADLTPHLAGEAVRRYPFLANVPTASWESTVYNGKILGIPIPRGAQSSQTFYVRRDLLEAQGIDQPPDSLATFLDLCRELTGARSNAWALGRVPLLYLRQMFEIPAGWSEQGGRLVSALEADGHEEALEAGRRLVAEQTVHPDAFGAQASARKTWMVNGATTMVDDTFSGWPGFYSYSVPDGFRLASWAPPLVDGGGTAPIWLGGPTHNITSINVDATDRVEALLDLLNYLAAPFGTAEYLFKYYGTEGEHHTLDGTDPVLTEQGRSETQLSLKYLGEAPWMIYQAGLPDVTRDQFAAQQAVVPTAVVDPTLGLYSETSTRRGAQIGLGDLENDIVQGRSPVSDWRPAVQRWKSDGGDAIRDELQRALDERRGG